MSPKILIFCLFSSLCARSSPNNVSQPETSQSWIKKNFMILNSKFDSLNKEFEQFLTNRSTGNEVNCVESSINSTIMFADAVQQLLQTQFDKLDEKFKKIENKLENISWQLLNNSQQAEDQLDRVHSNFHQSCNVCEPNPCVYGGRCVSILCGKDFRCVECPAYRSGVHCENFDCRAENLCWRHRKTVYVAFEPKSSWPEAERKCESEGMRLIMPKEKDQTEFIVKQLRDIYGTTAGGYFWMGIKRESGSGWRWTDGSELGSYTGGRSDFKSPSGDFYGFIYLHGGETTWSWAGPTSANVYPLCEKHA